MPYHQNQIIWYQEQLSRWKVQASKGVVVSEKSKAERTCQSTGGTEKEQAEQNLQEGPRRENKVFEQWAAGWGCKPHWLP